MFRLNAPNLTVTLGCPASFPDLDLLQSSEQWIAFRGFELEIKTSLHYRHAHSLTMPALTARRKVQTAFL